MSCSFLQCLYFVSNHLSAILCTVSNETSQTDYDSNEHNDHFNNPLMTSRETS